jgi:hypothetical protein
MAENTEETGTETTEPVTQENTASGQPQPETDSGGKDPHKAILADLAKERRERQRLARELDAEKAKGLTEAERAIAEAKAAGRQEAVAEAGKRLARAEIRAAAAAAGLKVSDDDLDDLDMAKFVGDDGEPATDAIAARIKRWQALAPEPSRPRGSIDQGNRGSSPTQSNADAFAEFLQNQMRATK